MFEDDEDEDNEKGYVSMMDLIERLRRPPPLPRWWWDMFGWGQYGKTTTLTSGRLPAVVGGPFPVYLPTWEEGILGWAEGCWPSGRLKA